MISRLDTAFLLLFFVFLLTFEGCQIVSDRSYGSCDALVRPGQSGKSFIIIKNDGGWDEIFHNIVLKKVGAGFLFRVKEFVPTTLCM